MPKHSPAHPVDGHDVTRANAVGEPVLNPRVKYSHPDRPRYGTARSDAPANARDATSGPTSRQLRCERPAFSTQRYDAFAPAIRAHEIEDSRTNGGGSSGSALPEQQSMPLMASFVHPPPTHKHHLRARPVTERATP